MFHCYLCETKYQDIDLFIRHFSLFHVFETCNRYICMQNDCLRIFQTIQLFKKHLIADHLKTNETSSNVRIIQPTADLSAASNNDRNNEDSDVSVSNSFLCEDEFICDLDNAEGNLMFDLKKQLQHKAAKLVSSFYNETSMNRKHVQTIIDTTHMFLKDVLFSHLKPNVLNILRNAEDTTLYKIEQIFNLFENPFESLDSEFKRFKYFKENGTLIEPESYVIGQQTIGKKIDSNYVIVPTNVTGQYIPVKSVLSKLFALPDFLQEILNYMQSLSMESNGISNIIQAESFKKLQEKYPNRIIIPLIFYYDEFEVNDPLGSQTGTHKIGSVYYSLPCIPFNTRSHLINIQVALLFNSNDRKEFGNRNTFLPLIKELKYLHTHPIYKTNNNMDIYVNCCLFVADNLGRHEIGGFVQCFSANSPCSVCKISRNELLSASYEKSELLRNIENYRFDVEKNDVSTTGINEECVFNEIEDFHILENSALDIMHDIYGGVCEYDLSQILLQYVVNVKLFTLQDLNDRIGAFDFGVSELSNRIPFLKREKLNNYHLGYTATQVMRFMKYFGLIIGDLVPPDDPHWQLYLTLRAIIDILNGKSFSLQEIDYLQCLITEHHEIYVKLFGNTLKTKHHNMLHYPRLMLRVGPLVNIWCMRFEAKHKESKIESHIITSRKNLPFTLAMKHLLRLNDRLLNEISLTDKPILGPNISIDSVYFHPHFNSFKEYLPEIYTIVSWIKIQSILFKPQFVLNISVTDLLPVFCIIRFICLNEAKEPFFVVQMLKTLSFTSHLYAYRISFTNDWKNIKYNMSTITWVTSLVKSVDGYFIIEE